MIEQALLKLAKKNFSEKEEEKFRFLFSSECGIVLSECSKHAAKLLFEIFPDYETIVATLLYEHIFHTSKSFFVKMGGKNFFAFCEKISHSAFIQSHSKEELLQIIFLSLQSDIRISFFLLAERHALLTLSYSLLAEKKVILAKEIFEIISPLAYRLGVHSLKEDLEDRAFSLLFHDDFKIIFDERSHFLRKKEVFFQKILTRIRSVFRRKKIVCRIQSRIKGIYSIFLKMQRKGRASLEDMNDVFALRIVVNTREECYAVLGEIHRLFPPIAGRIKDYIALPKSNGYQSIHTTISLVEDSVFIALEVQIRTEQMHKIAQDGFASHLYYKKNKTGASHRVDMGPMRQKNIKSVNVKFSHQNFLRNATEDLFAEKIFVFTRNQDIKVFPAYSTVLDFAYALHSHIGDYAEKAKMNGKEVSLFDVLENGSSVEIFTHENIPQVHENWLHYAKTPSAQKAIRNFLKEREKDAYLFDRN